MAAVTVGNTTPVKLDIGRHLGVIQNLGPGVVYFDNADDVSTSTGLRLSVGDSYEWTHGPEWHGDIYLIASQAGTDVRYSVVR